MLEVERVLVPRCRRNNPFVQGRGGKGRGSRFFRFVGWGSHAHRFTILKLCKRDKPKSVQLVEGDPMGRERTKKKGRKRADLRFPKIGCAKRGGLATFARGGKKVVFHVAGVHRKEGSFSLRS